MIEVAKVTARRGLHLRKEPNDKSEILATLPLGTEVAVLARSGNWLKVNYQFKTGYLYKDYVSVSKQLPPDIDLPPYGPANGVPGPVKVIGWLVLVLMVMWAIAAWVW